MDDPTPITVRELRADDPADVAAVQDLWQRCGLMRPWHDADEDVQLAVTNPSSTIVVGERDGRVVASALCGVDGHRGWVYRVAVEPDLQGAGVGRAIMTAAEDWLKAHGVPKVMLMIRTDNQPVKAFYDRLGYEAESLIVMSRWFDPERGSRHRGGEPHR